MQTAIKNQFTDTSFLVSEDGLCRFGGYKYMVVIVIGDRYFYEIKNGKVMTSFALWGAKLFCTQHLSHPETNRLSDLDKTLKKLQGKGKKYHLSIVQMSLPTEVVPNN